MMKPATYEDLEKMIIAELAKIKDCGGVKSIGFYEITEPGHPNWKPSFVNFGEADETLCKRALPKIIAKLQAEFELTADDT